MEHKTFEWMLKLYIGIYHVGTVGYIKIIIMYFLHYDMYMNTYQH